MATATIGTSSRDYSTPQAWESAVDGSLTEEEIGEMYADSDFTASVTFAGSTTSASNHMTLRAASADEHAGVPASTDVRFTGAQNGGEFIDIDDTFTEIEGIQFHDYSPSSTWTSGAAIRAPASGYTNMQANIHRCIFYDTSAPASGSTVSGTTCYRQIYVHNNLFINCYGEQYGDGGYSTSHIYNNSFYNCGDSGDNHIGPGSGSGNEIKNNVCIGRIAGSDDLIDEGSHTEDYNAVSDTSVGNTNDIQSVTAANNYTDAANDDLSIKNSSADIYEAGTDLGTTREYDKDIVGTNRTGTWSIGAFAPTAGGDVTVNPAVIAADFTVQTETVTTGATITGTLAAADFTPQAPTVAISISVSPSVLAADFTIPAPSITTGATISGTLAAADFTIHAPTVSAISSVTVTPGVIAADFTMPAPAVGSGAICSPTTLACEFTVQTETATGGALYTGTLLSATFSMPVITITVPPTVVSPSVIAADFTPQAPTVSFGADVTTSLLSNEVTLQTPTITGDAPVTASLLSCDFTEYAPTVTATQSVTVSPAVLACDFSIYAVDVSTAGNITVSPNNVSVYFPDWGLVTTQPTITGGASFTNTVLNADFTIHAVASVTTGADIGMSEAQGTFTLYAPTVSTTQFVTVSPSVVNGDFTTYAPTVTGTGGGGAIAALELLETSFTIHTPLVTGQIYQSSGTAISPVLDMGGPVNWAGLLYNTSGGEELNGTSVSIAISTSSDGTTFSDYTDVASAVSTRYAKIKFTLNADSTGDYTPIVDDMQIVADLVSEDVPTVAGFINDDIRLSSTNSVYLGDRQTEGTWRFRREGDDLAFERLESGTWVEKGLMTAV
jgi:hypothetical protein